VVDFDAPDPVYVQVADDLAARIRSGKLSGRLPAERQLAEEYGVSYGSVRRAMALLRELKLIRSVHGRGTFATPETGRPASEGKSS
jgi:DNA-binding GntR family transcriptional regulator